MANTPLTTIRLEGWDGGVNLEADPTTLARNELAAATNVTIGLNGELAKRKGFAAYSTNHHANMADGEFVFYYNQLGSTSDFLIMVDSDGDVFSSSTANFSAAAVHDFGAATGADDYPIGFAIYQNVAYLTSRRNANAVKFDGSTWTAITDYTMDGGGSQFPRAKFLTVKHERVFAANINNNGTLERSRIRWSDVGDAETWESTNWIDVDPDDGTEITGIASFADGLVVFKENSIFFLSGVDSNTFTLFPVDSTVGTSSPGTITVTENAVFFLDRKGVYEFDGAEVPRISDKINTDILDTVSAANRYKNTAFFYRDKLYLCIHDGTQLNYTWVYDTRLKAWVRWDNGFYGATNKEGTMYVVGPVDSADDVKTGIFQWLSGETDGGTNYTASFRTGWISAKEQDGWVGRRFRIRYIDFVAEEGAGTLSVNLFEDFRTSTSTAGSVSLDNNNYSNVHRRVVFAPSLQSARTSFAVEASMTSGTNTFLVSGLEVLVSPRPRQRGGTI